MSEMASGTVLSKLMPFTVANRSYGDYFTHFGDVIKITWPWILAASALTGLSAWRQYSWMAGAIADLKKSVPVGPTPAPVPPMPDMPFDIFLLGLAANVLLVIAVPSIAVAWHRRLLLNESPNFAARNVLGGMFWRYVGNFLLISLVIGIPVAIFAGAITYPLLTHYRNIGPGPLPSELVWPMVLMAAIYVAAFLGSLRLAMMLPAAAVGNQELSMEACWRQTRGNTWRLFWGLVLTTVPPLLLCQLPALVLLGNVGADLFKLGAHDFAALALLLAFASAATVGVYLLVLPVGIGFLSHAYRHFFPET